MSFSLEEKNDTISKLEYEQKESNLFFQQLEEKFKACEEQLCKLSADKNTFKQEINEKEENIKLLEKVINNQNIEIEHKVAQSLEYEKHINLLKSKIAEAENKLSLLNDNEEKDKLIDEFQIKIDTLHKIIESLNISIKDMESELKNAYAEKQASEVKLNKFAEDNIQLNQDVSTWKEMCNSEKLANSKLMSKIEELETNITEATKNLNNCETLLSSSEKDVSHLKHLQREHEHFLLMKNQDLKNKDHTIDQLQEKIKEFENNNLSLKSKYSQLETSKSSLLHQLVEKNKQILELENKIEDLLNQSKLKEETHKELSDRLNLEVECLNKELTLEKKETTKLQKTLDSEVELSKSLKRDILEKDEKIAILDVSLKEHLTKISESEICISSIISEKEELKNKEMQLSQKMANLKKDMCAARYALEIKENKCLELSRENELLKENKSSKEIEYALSKSVQFFQSLLDSILEILRECSYTSANEKLITNLAALRKQLSQKTARYGVTDIDFSPDILKSLSLVLKDNIRNTDEELKIVGLISSISSFLNRFGQFIESHNEMEKSAVHDNPNFLDETMTTTLNISCITANIGDRTIFSHSQIQKELQLAQVQLSEYFSVIQNIICKQAEELKDLKFKLNKITLPVNSVDSKEITDINMLKRKLKLLRMNNQHWERDTNKLKKLYSEQKEKTKVLEEQLSNKEKEFDSKFKSLNEEKDKVEGELLQQIKKLKENIVELDEEAEELGQECKNLHDLRRNDFESLLELDRLKEKVKQYEKEYSNLSNSGKSCKHPLKDKENTNISLSPK